MPKNKTVPSTVELWHHRIYQGFESLVPVHFVSAAWKGALGTPGLEIPPCRTRKGSLFLTQELGG